MLTWKMGCFRKFLRPLPPQEGYNIRSSKLCFNIFFFIITMPFWEWATAPKCQISNVKCTTAIFSNILKSHKKHQKNKYVVIENNDPIADQDDLNLN